MATQGTINYKGFEFNFDYNYEPYEQQTYEYPGSPAQWEIYNITLNGIDASDLLENQIEEFDEYVIDNLTNN
jgi:hypothetical protein